MFSPITISRRRGFTLLELLVVIAIIGVLAAIILPVYRRTVQGAKASACIGNLRQLGVALNLYLGEHDQTMPTLLAGRASKDEEVLVIDNVLNTYAPDPRVFACPADTGHFAASTGTSYYWNNALNGQPLAGLTFMTSTTASNIPVLADKEGFHPYTASKVNILNADSHISQGLHFTVAP